MNKERTPQHALQCLQVIVNNSRNTILPEHKEIAEKAIEFLRGKLSPAPLPVVAIGDADLMPYNRYSVCTYDNTWHHDMVYRHVDDQRWFHSRHDGSLFLVVDDVAAVIENARLYDCLQKALNTAVEGLR